MVADMPAITQPTSSQAPNHVEDEDTSATNEWETYTYQKKPDVFITGFGVSNIRTFANCTDGLVILHSTISHGH